MGLPSGVFNVSYEKDLAIVRTRLQWGLLLLFLVFLFAIPFLGVADDYTLRLIISIAATVIAVQGLQILTGYCGLLSVGHSAFVAIGAFTSANLAAKVGLPLWADIPLAGIMAGLVGLGFGFPALRIKGFYLAMSTMAAYFIITYAMSHLVGLSGGVNGIRLPEPSLGGISLASSRSYYLFATGMVVLMTFFARNLIRSKTGRAFIAIRDNESAARQMGVNVFGYKLLAFFIGCFYAGIGGSVWAHYVSLAHYEMYPFMDSVWYLAMVVVGGMGSVSGTVFGVMVFKLLDQAVARLSPVVAGSFPAIGTQFFAAAGAIVWGLIIVLFLVYEPKGLAHRWESFKASCRLWPLSHRLGRRW